MAGIFTYHTEAEPPRVSSPWLKSSRNTSLSTSSHSSRSRPSQLNIPGTPPPGLLADYSVTKLEPEPQEGPVEFKLHLLLRPRRTYSSCSTGVDVAGSQQASRAYSYASRDTKVVPVPSPPSHAVRQNRFEHLTTQLLWRLQQSSPYHVPSVADFVLPQLPETGTSLPAPSKTGKLFAGLEGSRGALYEIGVSDDGTFVGLTEDEMSESLNNLKVMAASLGCVVEVTKMVMVGDCEWHSTAPAGSLDKQADSRVRKKASRTKISRHHAQLWVAEALVTPDLAQNWQARESSPPGPLLHDQADQSRTEETLEFETALDAIQLRTQQLRITLTGATTAGKSSLLGTLSTATLDNGRGKSRLSLLKHRHEQASGVTSSVTQELLGYSASQKSGIAADVVTYDGANISSWNDMHARAENGRLVFVCDSAGHPRYRRTTVRGLVGWAPHWTLLCIAANEDEIMATTEEHNVGTGGLGAVTSRAHLELCLKLEQPMAVVITKSDCAKSNLKQKLGQILTSIKSSGRTPLLITPDQSAGLADIDLHSIPSADVATVGKVVDRMDKDDLNRVVPIIMTSAVKGTGIRSLHALLLTLPIPRTPTLRDYVIDVLNPEQPTSLFHVEDIFAVPASYAFHKGLDAPSEVGTVVAGYLRFGQLSIGDKIIVGPFRAEVDAFTPSGKIFNWSSPPRRTDDMTEYGSFANARSFSSITEASRLNRAPASITEGEWQTVSIVSIRNLRLPVRTLEAGQVGTIGIVFDSPHGTSFEQADVRLQPPRVRKGMVLAIPSRHMIETGHTLQAASSFTASFDEEDVNSVPVGSVVVVYIASIRACARVVQRSPHVPLYEGASSDTESLDDDVFGLDGPLKSEKLVEPSIFGSSGVTDVTFELQANREWIELGSRVLIMPGGGAGLFGSGAVSDVAMPGLDGFVGRVVEVAG